MLKSEESDRLSWPEVFGLFSKIDNTFANQASPMRGSNKEMVSKDKNILSYFTKFMDMLTKVLRTVISDRIAGTLYRLKLSVLNLSAYELAKMMKDDKKTESIKKDISRLFASIEQDYQLRVV